MWNAFLPRCDDLAANDVLLGSTAPKVRTRISTVTDLGQALAGADHVFEDSLWDGPGKLADLNAAQVKLGMSAATPDEAREFCR